MTTFKHSFSAYVFRMTKMKNQTLTMMLICSVTWTRRTWRATPRPWTRRTLVWTSTGCSRRSCSSWMGVPGFLLSLSSSHQSRKKRFRRWPLLRTRGEQPWRAGEYNRVEVRKRPLLTILQVNRLTLFR